MPGSIPVLAEEKQKRALNDKMQDLVRLIGEWAADNSVEVDWAARLFKYRLPLSDEEQELGESEAIDWFRFGWRLGDEFGYTEGRYRCAMRIYMSQQRDSGSFNIRQEICGYNGCRITPIGDHTPIREVLKMILRRPFTDEELENHTIMFAQWVYNIKRLLIGEYDHNSVTPFLTGDAQGTGKTEFMRALCTPFGKLYRETNFTRLFEKFGFRPLSQFRILGLDDCDKGSPQMVAQFKRQTSSRFIDNRGMQREFSAYMQRIATMIGTAQHPVKDLVPDPTGARRLWEVLFTIQKINSYDNWETRLGEKLRLAFFQCVDETAEAPPIEPYLERIKKIQNTELRGVHIARRFLNEGLEPVEDASVEPGIPLMQFKKAMRIWADISNERQTLPAVEEIATELLRCGAKCEYDKKHRRFTLFGYRLLNL